MRDSALDCFATGSNHWHMDKLAAMATFVRVAEKGSLTRAAESLSTSLPSVVRSLAALERHLGVRLANRTTRRLQLTEEGRQFLERSLAVLSAVEDAEHSMRSGQAIPQGRLSVTAPELFGRFHVVPIVNRFIAMYPGVTIDLRLVDRVANLVDEGLDVGIRIGHLPDSSLVGVSVGHVRRVVCASPDYLQGHGRPRVPEELRAHRRVNFTALAPVGEWHFRRGKHQVSVPLIGAHFCNQVDAALELCASGLGLGMFLSYQVRRFEATGKLVRVLERFEPLPLPVHVVYPHSRLLSTRVRAFVDACVETLRQSKFD